MRQLTVTFRWDYNFILKNKNYKKCRPENYKSL
jgi:hypothetical protein